MAMIIAYRISNRFFNTTTSCSNKTYNTWCLHVSWIAIITKRPPRLSIVNNNNQQLQRPSIIDRVITAPLSSKKTEQQQQRSYAAAGRSRRFLELKKKKLNQNKSSNNSVVESKVKPGTISINNVTSETITTISSSSKNSTSIFDKLRYVIRRYRYDRNGILQKLYYNREQAKFIFLWRLPLWIILVTVGTWDETKPLTLISIHGPSMIPTMAPDRSDIWICRTYPVLHFLQRNFGFAGPTFQRGDIIGFAHPNHPEHISCKRIIGLPGDTVQRYGQYVHLFIEQDPENLGITWPSSSSSSGSSNNKGPYDWVDRECTWDMNKNKTLLDSSNDSSNTPTINLREVYRTIRIPAGSVWIEADCPALGIDSRQLGPIPMEWIRGKVIFKLWPFWHPSDKSFAKKDKRPHPIPLDDETLEQYNVYRIQTVVCTPTES